MTEDQQRALATAFVMLEQEFDHVILITSETEKRGVLVQPDFHACWSGGYRAAKSLVHEAADRLNHVRTTRRPPDVSKEIMHEVMKKTLKNHK